MTRTELIRDLAAAYHDASTLPPSEQLPYNLHYETLRRKLGSLSEEENDFLLSILEQKETKH